jgi:hypothetical protein
MDSYTDMAARTVTAQARIRAKEMEFLAHGQNLVRISSHLPTCPLCAPWNGVIVSLAEPTEEYPHTLDEARAAGLLHPSCRHNVSLMVEGFSEPGPSEPDYSEEAKRRNEEARAEAKALRGVEGFASGKAGDADGYSVITDVKPFDFNDAKAVEEVFRKFAEDTVESAIEKAIVISPDGHRYDIDGNNITVGVHLPGRKALKGAMTIHNHPGLDADSFSRKDFEGFFRYRLSSIDVVYNGKRHHMRWAGKRLTELEAGEAYQNALRAIQEKANKTHVPIQNEQYETMQYLQKHLKGLIFHEL